MNWENNFDYLTINPPSSNFRSDIIDLDNLPKVSFCIPTFNSSRTLEMCLKSILDQEYPDIEIIIADNGSKDNSVEIARRYTDKVYFDDGLLGSVRQTTVEHSKGEILAIFDSDIYIPHKKWLLNAIIYFNFSNKVSTIWPRNEAPPESSWTTKLYFNLWEIIIEHRIKDKKNIFGGGNALFLRECIDEIGGINRSIHWGEDFEWAKNLKKRGYQVVAIDDPLYHDTMHSIKEFARKQFVGSKTFTKEGFELMGLSFRDLIYENTVLGIKHMLIGLFIKRDPSWLIFPVFIAMRALGYGFSYIKQNYD